MARDIVDNTDEKADCPWCKKPVLVKTQTAYYELGEGTMQFVGVEKDEAARKERQPKIQGLWRDKINHDSR